MSDPLNPHPINLEFLRKQAKALLKSCRAGDPQVIHRICTQLPSLVDPAAAKLADVHHALARELGFNNWAALKRHDDPVERFLVAIRGSSLKQAQQELTAFPEMAEESIHAACAIGDPESVAHHLNLSPSLAQAEHGGWPPLFYACGSPLHRSSARQSAGIVECVRLLLDHGVDPNTSVLTDPSDPESTMTAKQRTMMSANMAVMMLLVERGARMDWAPRFSEEFKREQPLISGAIQEYLRAPETRERAAAAAEQAKAWAEKKWWIHLRPDMSAMTAYAYRGLLERGFDPNKAYADGLTVFQHMARRGDREAVELFIKHGADINAPAPDGRTPLVLAIRAGNKLSEDVLRAHGASDAGLRPVDELIGACLRVDHNDVRRILKTAPDAARECSAEEFELLVQAAAMNVTAQVRLMAECGIDVGGFGENGITALHAAAWHGHVHMVGLLLEFHAPLDARDLIYGSSPLAWAADGSKRCRSDDDTYCKIVGILLAAGASREAAVSRSGVDPKLLSSDRVGKLL
jgi:ankyrin repeat protein